LAFDVSDAGTIFSSTSLPKLGQRNIVVIVSSTTMAVENWIKLYQCYLIQTVMVRQVGIQLQENPWLIEKGHHHHQPWKTAQEELVSMDSD
jgi:hypothetical protein